MLLLFVLLGACTRAAAPLEVASEFWTAQMARDTERLRRLVRDSDVAGVEGGLDVLPISAFELGDLRVTGSSAEIDTRLTLAGKDALHLSIVTVMTRSGDSWRVDYPATVRDIASDSPLAKLITQLQGLTSRLGAGVNQSLEELKRALPKLESELSDIEKDIRSQVPELRRRLDDLLRDLPETKPASPPSTERKAI